MQSFNPFDVDFFKLSTWLIPKSLRRVKIGVLFKASMFPLFYVHNVLLKYRDAKIYELNITPQVCYLEKLLNDRFDYTQRRIYIIDGEWHLPLFIFQEQELKPVHLFKETEGKPMPLFTDGEAGSVLNDFVVMVPLQVQFSDAEMSSLINRFKLFGTKYTIQTF
jgi:hypothetical protein